MANQTQITLGKEAMEAIRATADKYAAQGKQYGSFADRFKGAEVQLGDQFLEPDAPAGIFGTASDVASRLAVASAREDEKLMDLMEQKAEQRAARIAQATPRTVPAETRLPFNEEEASFYDTKRGALNLAEYRANRAPSAQDQKTAGVVSSMRADIGAIKPLTVGAQRELSRVDTQQALAHWKTVGWARGVGQMLAEPFKKKTRDDAFMSEQVRAHRDFNKPMSRSEQLFKANRLLEAQTPTKVTVPSRSSNLADAYRIMAEQENARKAKKLVAKK